MARTLRMLALAVILGAAGLFAPVAEAREFPIGSITYETRPEREVINLNGRDGDIRAMRFEVRQSDVEVLDLRVVYQNGQTEDIRVRQVFRAGTSSRVIDIVNWRRGLVRQIIITYLPRGPARIVFFGIAGGGVNPPPPPSPPPPGPGGWVRLGCKEVKFLVDRDTLRVGRAEGKFAAVRLKVRHAPIEMFNLRVTFGNGTMKEVPVREVIPAGATTRAIDFNGSYRGIDRIEMIYRALPSFRGIAEVCVDGLER
jgi:hypothetical protein